MSQCGDKGDDRDIDRCDDYLEGDTWHVSVAGSESRVWADQQRARTLNVLSSSLGWVLCQSSIDNDKFEITFFRLCDLKSLTNRRGSSEYDSINKESSKSYKPTKKKQIGLGDISSNSDSKDSDQEEGSSDDENKFEGFKV